MSFQHVCSWWEVTSHPCLCSPVHNVPVSFAFKIYSSLVFIRLSWALKWVLVGFWVCRWGSWICGLTRLVLGKISAMVSSNVFLPAFQPPSRFSRSQMTRIGPLSIIQQATEALFDVLSLLATIRPVNAHLFLEGPRASPAPLPSQEPGPSGNMRSQARCILHKRPGRGTGIRGCLKPPK